MVREIRFRFVRIVFRILVRVKISKWPPTAHVVGKERETFMAS